MPEDTVTIVYAEIVLPGLALNVGADYETVLIGFGGVRWSKSLLCAV
jgi:hypothetical protein